LYINMALTSLLIQKIVVLAKIKNIASIKL